MPYRSPTALHPAHASLAIRLARHQIDSEATPGKAVMELNFSDRLKIGEAPRQRLTTHSVRTLGYVDWNNLRSSRYMLLEGSLD